MSWLCHSSSRACGSAVRLRRTAGRLPSRGHRRRCHGTHHHPVGRTLVVGIVVAGFEQHPERVALERGLRLDGEVEQGVGARRPRRPSELDLNPPQARIAIDWLPPISAILFSTRQPTNNSTRCPFSPPGGGGLDGQRRDRRNPPCGVGSFGQRTGGAPQELERAPQGSARGPGMGPLTCSLAAERQGEAHHLQHPTYWARSQPPPADVSGPTRPQNRSDQGATAHVPGASMEDRCFAPCPWSP